MNNRQKAGVSMIGTAVVSAVVGIVVIATGHTPEWLSLALQAIPAVAAIFGITLNLPANTDPQ